MIRVSITNAHGTFTTTTAALDDMITQYQHDDLMRPAELRMVLGHHTRTTGDTYSDVDAASELLIMLASIAPQIPDDDLATQYGDECPCTDDVVTARPQVINGPTGRVLNLPGVREAIERNSRAGTGESSI